MLNRILCTIGTQMQIALVRACSTDAVDSTSDTVVVIPALQFSDHSVCRGVLFGISTNPMNDKESEKDREPTLRRRLGMCSLAESSKCVTLLTHAAEGTSFFVDEIGRSVEFDYFSGL